MTDYNEIQERARKARAKKIYYKGEVCYGYPEFHARLEEDYPGEFELNLVKDMVNPKRGLSKKRQIKYPELTMLFLGLEDDPELYIDDYAVVVMDTNRKTSDSRR